MRVNLVLFILFNIFFVTTLYGQERNEDNSSINYDQKPSFKDKLVLGGNVGANFGTRTFVQISPLIGYRVKPKLITGAGFNYNYFSNPFQQGSIYGPSIFTRYRAFQDLFLHAEYQQSYTKFKQKGGAQEIRSDFPMLLLGGGYSAGIGGNSRIGITVLFDVIEDPNSFYQNPILRGGVLFGL